MELRPPEARQNLVLATVIDALLPGLTTARRASVATMMRAAGAPLQVTVRVISDPPERRRPPVA